MSQQLRYSLIVGLLMFIIVFTVVLLNVVGMDISHALLIGCVTSIFLFLKIHALYGRWEDRQ